MGNDLFLNAGIPASATHFDPTSLSQMPPWNSFSSAMEIQPNDLNCSSEQSLDCFFKPNWERSTDHSLHFDSALSSMVSSPVVSNSNISNESVVIRKLIRKLGNNGNSGEISPHSFASHMNNGNNSDNCTTTTTCYTTPLNPPYKLNLPIMDHFVKEKLQSLENSMSVNSSVAEFSNDPGFVERAARFSGFGSRSFSGRTSQVAPNNPDSGFRSNTLMANEKLKLPRISSSPSLKVLGSQAQANGVQGKKNSPLQDRSERANSRVESSVSEQVHQNGVIGGNSKNSNDLNSKKRKAVSTGKGKEPTASPSANYTKVAESDDNCNSNSKRCKPNEGSNEADAKNAEDDKQTKTNRKLTELPKDYIHVRARRGQATDNHSLAERVRREKISERMKLLQDLVPGCNKVTGKALMLDEIINYVQSLQRQVEFLSMKLASVNTRMDYNVGALMSKDAICHTNKPLPRPIFQLDSSASAFLSHQTHQNPAELHRQCSMDPFDNSLCRYLSMQMQSPQLDQFTESILPPQHTNFCEDDLQSIVQMGFGNNPNGDTLMQSHGPNEN